MYIDAELEFSDAQAVTSSAISTNVVDLGATNTLKDIGTGEDLWLVVRTNEAATDSGSDATLTVALVSDSVATLNSSATTHITTGALAFGTFSPKGAVLVCQRLPQGNYERYLGVSYTVASGPLTGGSFDAFIVKDISAFRAYANGDNIHPNA